MDSFEQLTGIAIEIESDATLGYASIQNSVPVLRSLRLTNHGTEAIENLQVLITCNPRFAKGIKLRFDRLGSGETRRISPIDLQPDHTFLAELQESVTATIKVSVLTGTEELAHASQPMDVLAYDQWAGTRALPELLAAFCMPNNPAVDVLIASASKLLRSEHPELSMDGYQSKSRDVVWKQVSALYSTISSHSLQYAEPPASFGTDGQKIRTPERILEARVATCLDLAMLFASCFEQAGLRAVVLMKEGHAWVGVWLHSACFPDPLTDDAQAIRKRVDSGEFLTFETTGVAQHHSRRPSLRIALEQGHAHLQEEDTFRFAIDIHRARELQIKPLPSRATTARRSQTESDEAPAAIEPTPHLPSLDPELLTPLDLPAEDTPEGRLSKWKSKLLDLTLRNRLLNFKPTKSTLQFVAPDLARLEDALSEGAEFRIRPLPSIMEGTDPRVAQVHADRGGRTPLDDMAIEALAKKELLARVQPEALDGNLLSIFGAARTGLEEGGANTLYLAIGLLRWTEAEKAESVHLAPILLIPVSLQRQSVRSGFRLSRHDDEAIVNPTLLQLLKHSFEIRTAGLDVIATDDKGVDVEKVLQSFRLAVREIPKWEVLEQAHLGIFSFTKYLMWKDLQDRTEQLKGNRVVKHLIENPGQAFARDPQGDGDFERLDDSHRPQDILAPLLSDSSQLKAICVVDAGRDLVLEGPPGTGKSQTITNLIAHTLAKGKTVLFVSEKLAALEVVHRRLVDIKLGPFCLQLHSSKAKKTDVLQQLGKALDIAGQRTAQDWEREAELLAQLRQELNELVGSLHRSHPSGLTVFDAIGTCIEHSGQEPSPMPWADALTHSQAELDQLRLISRRMSALAGSLGAIQGHPLSLIGHGDWSPTWQDELLDGAQIVAAAVSTLREQAQILGKVLGYSVTGLSLEAYAAVDQLADILLGAPKVPIGLARHAHDVNVRARIHSLVKHGTLRAAHWDRVGPGWKHELSRLNGTELKGEWWRAVAAWWPKSFFAKRGIKARLASFRINQKRPTDADLHQMLACLADVNEEDQFLRPMHADAESLLQDSYSGIMTDWTGLAEHEQWAARFAQAVVIVAGGDAERTAALRARLQPFVAEDRALLAPSGQIGRALLGYRDAWRAVRQSLVSLDAVSRPVAPLAGPPGSDGALERIQGVVAGWQSAKRLMQPWCLWRNVRDQAIGQGLQGLVSSLEGGIVSLADGPSHFEFSYRSWWVKKTIDNDPVLRSFSSADHERKIYEFRQADEKFQQLTERYIAAKLSGKLPSSSGVLVGADTELGRLRRELQKQRGHMPVRQLVRGLPTLLPKLKPCLLMSPLSVAQYLDAGHAQFDLVVFDEASQIPVWDAVGAIARGKQLAVVGDPKQLPPTNFFHKSNDSDGTDSEEQVEDLESILDECLGAGMNRLSLQWHYRSRHESLITFSNINYYDAKLITFPSPVTDDVAVRFDRIHGVYDRGGSRTNRIEAEAVVAGIEKHYLDATKKLLTLGVVTFNQPQQALIETLLDARRRANQALDRAISTSSHEPLFIKNLENVQGDERDVIFFSITFGPDAAGKTTMNFGPLNGEGGHRRLNVAISRAREAIVVYSTLMPEQIDLAKVRAAGARDLKNYLQFALKGPRALVEQSSPTGLEPESPFEVAVIKMLRDRGWTVHPQIGCSGYRIDIGVVDPRAPGRYLVGVECDGATYHSGATARDRDRLRQHVLEGLGWRIHRIWSTDWWMNAEGEIESLTKRLQALLEEDASNSKHSATGDTLVNPEALDEQEPLSTGEDGDKDAALHAPTAAPSGEQSLRIFAPASLPRGNSAQFYEFHSSTTLTQHLALAVEAEGPISELVLFRRVARAWGLERTGSRIVERLRTLTPKNLQRTTEGGNTFYWPKDAQPKTWSDCRVCDHTESSRRHTDDVCLEELSCLALHVLGHSGASPRPDLARSVCRLLGMARTPAESEARINTAVDRLVLLGAVSDQDGSIRPAT